MTPTQIIQGLNPTMYADAGLSIYLLLAENVTSRGYFQSAIDNSDMAVALRAMHIWTLAQRTLGESGAVGSKSEGQLSISYVAAILTKGMANENLRQTQWGLQLWELIRQQGPIMGIVKAPISPGDYLSPEDIKDFATQLISGIF